MAVVVASCTLENLFSGVPILASDGKVEKDVHGMLAIPEYQRPYRWNEEQITRLLNDFKLHQQELAGKPEAEHCPFYLGSVILHQQGCKLNIIDGQQRLTTMALISHLANKHSDLELVYESPESQQQIKHNLGWLYKHETSLADIDFAQINITLVVTDSEDEAYRFFETQNTGGVRLAGPDIIKAHHLNVIDKQSPHKTKFFATMWEDLKKINKVVDLLLRGRYWEQYNLFKDSKDISKKKVPLHTQKRLIVENVVDEFSSPKIGEDIAYGRILRSHFDDGRETFMQPEVGYALRQPLNSGANTIRYLQYFKGLQDTYLSDNENFQGPPGFYSFYQNCVCTLKGCDYLKQLYDACLLLYISQHGQSELEVAAKKLFRVVYSRRVSNQTAVREKSIPSFVKDTPVLDWIAMSYSSGQLFEKLDSFVLYVNPEGIIKAEKSPQSQKSSTKQKFIDKVICEFSLSVEKNVTSEEYARLFSASFTEAVK
ncbi:MULTISPECIES: DUF262 domain-containing protein [unclassified Photobacterium]|uniref:DUF262 domain-containing protein n=1 Tax=unclassified Photobacterium TaxID=2628852 RepID=UPI000D156A83|nr:MULTISPECIES: DUF262 domain-containing protein [unclassified Photobacterium]PSV30831.1 DUF262 domain-containing protein [Photobacterium sp. GB-72]PSV57499.1 DUF262 domain-containing protein [Photobacterium sp. GB-3]